MRTTKTTIKQIAKYWMDNPPYPETDLNFDWADATTHCWNCGDNKLGSDKKIRLERCHIIPHALDGPDTPENYVLLCKECHANAPNSKNPKYMWQWILSNKTQYGLTDMYKINKALELFKQRTGEDFMIDVLPKLNTDKINDTIINEFKNINPHGVIFNSETFFTMFAEIKEKYKE